MFFDFIFDLNISNGNKEDAEIFYDILDNLPGQFTNEEIPKTLILAFFTDPDFLRFWRKGQTDIKSKKKKETKEAKIGDNNKSAAH